MAASNRESGFTLVEVLIATGLLVTAVVALAQVFAAATGTGVVVRRTTYATLLAEQKLEELKSTARAPSPAGTLRASTPGFVEHLDQRGRLVGEAAAPPPHAAFTRRWSVEAVPGETRTLLIQVSVVASYLSNDPLPVEGPPDLARLLAVTRP